MKTNIEKCTKKMDSFDWGKEKDTSRRVVK